MDAEKSRAMLALGLGAAAGISVGAFLCRRPSKVRTKVLKAVEGEVIHIPADSRERLAARVIRAFYGHHRQKDVTAKVREILSGGGSLKADNKLFGDPIPGQTKALVVELQDTPGILASGESNTDEDGDDVEETPDRWRPKDMTKVPMRPSHYVLRPSSDPRLDQSMYVRYDPAPDHKSGAIIIVIPGGNYDVSSIDGGEAQDTAHWLVELGITAIVLQYRCASVGHYWPAQFEDWQECARAVRRDAASWGCDPNRIGAIGYSAGGHLAGYAAVCSDAETKPKLQILVYPGIDTLAPEDGDIEPWYAYKGYPPKEASVHLQDCSQAPPAFLVGIAADLYCPPAQNTDVYARVLKDCGHEPEYVLHEDDQAEHGCGLRTWWTDRCELWLQRHGWALPPESTGVTQ